MKAGMAVGTVGYMSPEQASGEAVDFRSDQFSFGSILYEMATGKRAFHKKTGVDTLAAVLNEEPEPISQINPAAPAPLRWIVERCLATWTLDTRDQEARRTRGSGVQIHTRQLVLMRMITHDAFHSGEISLVLGSNGLGAIDPWVGMSRAER